MRPGMKAGPLEARLCMATQVFKCDVLRIHLSELNETQERHSLGIKESFYQAACLLLSPAWSAADGQIFSHDESVRISSFEAVRQRPTDVSEAHSLR